MMPRAADSCREQYDPGHGADHHEITLREVENPVARMIT